MFPVELSKGFLDVSVEFFGSVLARFVDLSVIDYIAVTKRICDELSENTVGKDCTEIYQKTKEVLQHFKEKKGHTRNTTKEEQEAIKTLKEDSSHIVLTVDKGVALVVMDKSQYIDKFMDLLNDTKVYKPWALVVGVVVGPVVIQINVICSWGCSWACSHSNKCYL